MENKAKATQDMEAHKRHILMEVETMKKKGKIDVHKISYYLLGKEIREIWDSCRYS